MKNLFSLLWKWIWVTFCDTYEQISTLETTYREVSDIYDVVAPKGLSQNCILKLPSLTYHSYMLIPSNDLCCSICIQVLSFIHSFFFFVCLDNIIIRLRLIIKIPPFSFLELYYLKGLIDFLVINKNLV